MKTIFASVLLLLLLLTARFTRAQSLYISPGTDVAQFGDIYNFGTVENAGSYLPGSGRLLVSQGDFLVTGTGTIGTGSATVELNDPSAARTLTLRGQALPNLEVNTPAGTTLGSDGSISTSLTLTSGHLLTTNAYTLTLAPGAVIVGETDAHYVKGHVIQTLSLSGSSVVDFGQMGFTLNPNGQALALTVQRRTGLMMPGISQGQNPVTAPFRGIDRIWAFSSVSTVASPVSIVLSWLADNNNGLTFAGNNAQVWRSDDNGATWVKQNAAANGTGLSMSISTTLLNALYTVSTTGAPLPVELLAFSGTLKGDDGLLSWRTASEKNSDYFEVQQSPDGHRWNTLDRVEAAGTSTAPHAYSFTDARLSRYGVPVVYYRLRQVDQSGSASFSQVVPLKPGTPAALALALWPNPAAATAELRITTPTAAEVTVLVYDGLGRLVYQHLAMPGIALPLPSATWPSGAYLVRAMQGSSTAATMLVRQ